MRVGFTCSKKVGNAVARNRAKRRLRAVAREVLPDRGRAGLGLRADRAAGGDGGAALRGLLADLAGAIEAIHAPKAGGQP